MKAGWDYKGKGLTACRLGHLERRRRGLAIGIVSTVRFLDIAGYIEINGMAGTYKS